MSDGSVHQHASSWHFPIVVVVDACCIVVAVAFVVASARAFVVVDVVVGPVHRN